jgi:glutamyl-tRNA(Gln) amidotransferase subunit D
MMSDDIFQGYKGQALKVLKKFQARVWGKAKINTTRGLFEGTILPRSENDDDKHIVLKIFSGYNIGINIDTINNIEELGFKKAKYKIPEKEFPYSDNMPNVKLFGTGGTIASRRENSMERFQNSPISVI